MTQKEGGVKRSKKDLLVCLLAYYTVVVLIRSPILDNRSIGSARRDGDDSAKGYNEGDRERFGQG
ncbi:MAG TPA: hypothetical protein VKK81_28725 [Candidatus Binatia bacterium]|nr:hypothetical protein [Candidatus Binatia bacterium]